MKELARKLKLDCLSFEEFKKIINYDENVESRLTNIGFDLTNGCYTDVKFYFSKNEKGTQGIYEERSSSIVRKETSALIRHISKHYSKTLNDGIESIQNLLSNDFSEGDIVNRFVEYGKIIQYYTLSKVYPYFGGGLVYSEDGKVQGAKLYYTLYAYESAEVEFGTVDREASVKCMNELVNLLKLSSENKEKISELFEMFHDRIVITLFAVNVSITGDEEYKIYFILPEESLRERQETLKRIHSLLWNTSADSQIDVLLSVIDECDDYCFVPLEICISILKNHVSLKAYFRVKN